MCNFLDSQIFLGSDVFHLLVLYLNRVFQQVTPQNTTVLILKFMFLTVIFAMVISISNISKIATDFVVLGHNIYKHITSKIFVPVNQYKLAIRFSFLAQYLSEKHFIQNSWEEMKVVLSHVEKKNRVSQFTINTLMVF